MDNKNMKSIENRAISRRFFQEVCTDGDLEVIKELVTEDAVHRNRDEEEYHGPEGVRDWISAYRIAFPDLRVVVETQIAEGDWVATRYLMSTRGRGLSSAPSTPDYSLEHLVEDVISFTESVGERVGLVGYSAGGMFALSAAAHLNDLMGTAVYEPAVVQATEKDASGYAEAARRMGEAVAEGRFADAARMIVEPRSTSEELNYMIKLGYFRHGTIRTAITR